MFWNQVRRLTVNFISRKIGSVCWCVVIIHFSIIYLWYLRSASASWNRQWASRSNQPRWARGPTWGTKEENQVGIDNCGLFDFVSTLIKKCFSKRMRLIRGCIVHLWNVFANEAIFFLMYSWPFRPLAIVFRDSLNFCHPFQTVCFHFSRNCNELEDLASDSAFDKSASAACAACRLIG